MADRTNFRLNDIIEAIDQIHALLKSKNLPRSNVGQGCKGSLRKIFGNIERSIAPYTRELESNEARHTMAAGFRHWQSFEARI